jgi:hypothetical protein
VRQRLVRLAASFISGSGDYTLARLEFGLKFPAHGMPPTLTRLPDASEEALRARWDTIESEVEGILAFVKRTDDEPGTTVRSDSAYLWLKRTARELDQYARALRWVLTVSERG